jgi:phosphatidylglycerol:prolipoprotein diacylglycerol transferase
MHPFLVDLVRDGQHLRLPMYGILIVVALATAFAYAHTRAKRVGIQPDKMVLLYVGAAIGGIVGARLLYAVAVDPWETLRNPLSLVTAWGGLAVYGGLFGGAVGVLVAIGYMGLPGWKVFDIAGPATLIGMGLGRVGCFFAGCCHGAISPIRPPDARGLLSPGGFLAGQIWVAGRFPFVAVEVNGGMGDILHQPLYPTQLWSAVYLLGLAGILIAVSQRRRFDGQVGGIMLAVEPIFRILVESYRADERGYVVSWEVESVPSWLPPGFSHAGPPVDTFHTVVHVVGITTSQFIGVFLVLAGVVILVVRRNAGVAPEVPIEDD